MPITLTFLYVLIRKFRQKHPILGFFLKQTLKLPLILQFLVLIYGYYLYVYLLLICAIANIHCPCNNHGETKEGVGYMIQLGIYFIVFNLLSFMYCWCLFRMLTTKIAKVPSQFKVDEETAKRLEEFYSSEGRDLELPLEKLEVKRAILNEFAMRQKLKLVEIGKDECLRYCSLCRHIKPDRSHHCRSCDFCVLKWDHHCPYIFRCVCFSNYKYYFLMCVYGVILCLWTIATEIEGLIAFISKGMTSEISQLSIGMIIQFLGMLFLIDLLRFHYQIADSNTTTVENYKDPKLRVNGDYDLGRAQNWQSVLGLDRCLWGFPVCNRPKGEDGTVFRIRRPDGTVFCSDVIDV